MPYQIDTAYEVIREECSGYEARQLLTSLQNAYTKSIPNLSASSAPLVDFP